MSFASDNHNVPRDVGFRPVGMGHHVGWSCLGCGQRRFSTAGSRGAGVKKRCGVCVAAREAKKAAQP